MKLDMDLNLLKDIEDVESILDHLKISKMDDSGKRYSLFIRIGFLIKQFENERNELNEKIEELKNYNRELKTNIKFLKKGY